MFILPNENDELYHVWDCDCKTKIAFHEDEVQYGEYGCPYIICPRCKAKVDLTEIVDSLELTVDNIQYPQHFTQYVTTEANLSDDDINRYVSDILRRLKESPEEDFYFVDSGGVMVFGYRCDCGVYIVVSKGYEESFVAKV